jgi:hypothetical protein
LAGGTTYTANFYTTINGNNFTPYLISWQLDDVDDGISTLRVTLGNPDGIISGYVKPELEVTHRYGYWDGRMSKPVTMKIKDLTEDYPTQQACTISFTAYDCTERLVGSTHAGNSDEGADLSKLLESLLEGGKITPDVKVESPKNMPEKTSLHNMNNHSAIRWIMNSAKCKGQGGGGGGGQTPIAGQPEVTAGDSFKNAESVDGDRSGQALADSLFAEIDKVRLNNVKKRARADTITGKLEIVGHPGIEAKKCITILNVGPEASGKWYVKKSSQRYDTGKGYTTHLDLLRANVGKDGKPEEQPMVMYAKIYEKDTVYIGCREIDGESQATFTYGQPDENGEELVMRFSWSIRTQQGRNAGEQAKAKGWAINKAKELQKPEAPKTGSWKPQSQAPPPLNSDTGYA